MEGLIQMVESAMERNNLLPPLACKHCHQGIVHYVGAVYVGKVVRIGHCAKSPVGHHELEESQ